MRSLSESQNAVVRRTDLPTNPGARFHAAASCDVDARCASNAAAPASTADSKSMVSRLRRVPSLPNRFYDWVRDPAARSLAGEERTVSGFGHLRGHKYCLLVTYKRSGEPVPTPVWFGLADGKLYVRSDASAA